MQESRPPVVQPPPLPLWRELQHGAQEVVWEAFCGWLDLSPAEFLEIQADLLEEQARLLRGSPLARALSLPPLPGEPDPFRKAVPLRTWGDYAHLFNRPNPQATVRPPVFWAYTTREQGAAQCVPVTQEAYQRMVDALIGGVILATARQRGEVLVTRGTRILYSLAPRPYLAGYLVWGIHQRTGWHALPSPDLAERAGFSQALRSALQMALYEGVDVASGLTSVLVHIGRAMAEGGGGGERPSLRMVARHPMALHRLLHASLRRALGLPILPRHLWHPQAVMGWGVDTAFYAREIEHLWGVSPYEFFGMTTTGVIAYETWCRGGLVFTPFLAFLEFLPYEEGRPVPSSQPGGTVLLPYTRPGRTYELVVTSFHGMPFIRLRTGILFRRLAEGSREDARLPRFSLAGRVDGAIDLGGFTRLSRASLRRALEVAEVPCRGWAVAKEPGERDPVLRFYLGRHPATPEDAPRRLHLALCSLDPSYADLERMLGLRPVRVSLVEPEEVARALQGGALGEPFSHPPAKRHHSTEAIRTEYKMER